MKIKLDRPLAIFDIEATGINPRADRIVELAIVKLVPKGGRETFESRINPEMPIPPEATEIHGIKDSDVVQCPTFTQLAPKIAAFLEDCDLGGYNILHYDIPMLCEEFLRAKMAFSTEGRRVLDAQRIYHKREPRDLAAALSFYCGELHLGAHGALEDVLATIRVIDGQIERYSDLPKDLAALDAYCNPKDPSWVDRTGKLKWVGDEIVINFGKKQGKKLKEIVQNESSFLQWMMKSDFPRDTQEIIQNALNGKYPEKKPG